jgi:hypothetical protein
MAREKITRSKRATTECNEEWQQKIWRHAGVSRPACRACGDNRMAREICTTGLRGDSGRGLAGTGPACLRLVVPHLSRTVDRDGRGTAGSAARASGARGSRRWRSRPTAIAYLLHRMAASTATQDR